MHGVIYIDFPYADAARDFFKKFFNPQDQHHRQILVENKFGEKVSLDFVQTPSMLAGAG